MDAIELEFRKAEEASKRTFGTVYKDLRVAHHAFSRGHSRWSYQIIDLYLTEYSLADDANALVGSLTRIWNALGPTPTPLAA